jgi:molybdopterin-binding protein
VGRDDHIEVQAFYDRRVAEYLRIGEVAQAVGVSVDTLRRWEANGSVQFERRGNQRVLRADKLAALTTSVSGADKTSSARNRLHGVVVAITRDRVMAQVEMVCGEFRVVSLMSREAADELGLEVGKQATAVIKSTNVIVEV